MIVRWTGHGQPAGEGVYPGGQSENPASPWYEDQMADWWNGRYLPMPPAGGYAAGPVPGTLSPGGRGGVAADTPRPGAGGSYRPGRLGRAPRGPRPLRAPR